MILNKLKVDTLRAEAGLTVNQLSALSHSAPTTIQKARQGEDISALAAARIAKVLNIPLAELIDNSEEATNERLGSR